MYNLLVCLPSYPFLMLGFLSARGLLGRKLSASASSYIRIYWDNRTLKMYFPGWFCTSIICYFVCEFKMFTVYMFFLSSDDKPLIVAATCQLDEITAMLWLVHRSAIQACCEHILLTSCVISYIFLCLQIILVKRI